MSRQYDTDPHCLLGDFIKAGPGVTISSGIVDDFSGFKHSLTLLNMLQNSTLRVLLIIPTRLAPLINRSFDLMDVSI